MEASAPSEIDDLATGYSDGNCGIFQHPRQRYYLPPKESPHPLFKRAPRAYRSVGHADSVKWGSASFFKAASEAVP
ncbi:MAG: hypothetical protein ACUVXA_17715 [Candidatus Jordarchaeum sp.]|uniref:hypothetical protein n=1 Tax=Candidatus Jordarchaeum sp. TaxID=2823881 RepID=UPI0040493ED3